MNFSRRNLLGTLAAYGVVGYAPSAFAEVDKTLCDARKAFMNWTIEIAIRSRLKSEKFVGHKYLAVLTHRPTGLEFSINSGSTAAIQKEYLDDGLAASVTVPDSMYHSLFTPEHQGATPRQVRTFFLLKDPDTGGETSIVNLFTPMDTCEVLSGGEFIAKQAENNYHSKENEPCVSDSDPSALPRLNPLNPNTRGWAHETASKKEQFYAAVGLLRSAEQLQLKTRYYDTGAKKWKVLNQFDIDIRGLTGALDSLFEESITRLAREGGGPETCLDEAGCFLTTVCCSHMGRADDCFELRTLRAFRDGWLASHPEGHRKIGEYYRIAPALARAIESDYALLDRLYWGTILPCVAAIRLGANGLAFRLYVRMMRRLRNDYPQAV